MPRQTPAIGRLGNELGDFSEWHNADDTAHSGFLQRQVAIDVRDYGAVGDGVTDDTAAIQAAIAACPQFGKVVLRGGQYRITQPIVMSTGFVGLIGEGMAYINQTGSGAIIEMRAQSLLVENLYLTTAANANGANGIHMDGAINCRLKRLYVTGAQRHTVYCINTYNLLTTDCLFNSPADAGYASFYHDAQSNEIVHIRSRFYSGARTGAYVRYGSPVSFLGCTFEGTAGVGVIIDNARETVLRSCYFEGHDVGVQIGDTNDPTGVLLDRNYFYVVKVNGMCVDVRGCREARISGNNFYGQVKAGSIGVNVGQSSLRVLNLTIDADNVADGVLTGVADTIRRARYEVNRVTYRSTKPADGTVYEVGDVVFNTSAGNGKAVGWICYLRGNAIKEAWVTGHSYTAQDVVGNSAGYIYRATTTGTAGATEPSGTTAGVTESDGAVTWMCLGLRNVLGQWAAFYIFGQAGMRQGAGSPVGVLTPWLAGEVYMDYNVPDLYMSYNTTSSGWKKIT